jgi:hypothetical protein
MTKTKRSILRAVAMPAALLLTVSTGCNLDQILKVDPANLIPAVVLETPINSPLLVAGAASDFDCAFNSFVVVGALIGEEFEDALQTASRWPYDQRNVTASQPQYSTSSCTGLGIYAPLQSARVSTNNVARLLNGWTDPEMPIGFNRSLAIARMQAYEAWSQLFLAEVFCECVFSTVEGEEVIYAGITTRTAALDAAIASFTTAIASATALASVPGDSIKNFALAGRARANLDRGNLAAARADAVLVPVGYVWNVTSSNANTRRQNRVFQENGVTAQPSSSVGLYYRTLNDPRVPVTNLGTLSTGTNVPRWRQNKYTTVSSSIPVTSATEMQLIIAEADIAGNRPNTLAIIATMRTAGAQPAYAGTTPAEDLAEIIDQRRRALWLTGTHFADVIRYNLTISPAQGAATPWGQTFGANTGSSLCLPLPEVEKFNNPVIQ